MRKNRHLLSGLLMCIIVFLIGCGESKEPTKASIPIANDSAPRSSPVSLTTYTPGDIDSIAASVVKLEAYDKNDKKIATGTGFAYGDPVMLLTSAHVIVNSEYLIATKDDGEAFEIKDAATYADKDADIALYKIPEGVTLPALSIASETPPRGTPIFTIGSQAGLTNLVTVGNISGTWIEGEREYIIFTAPVSGGNSGGPILSSDGKLLGIVIGTYEKAQNLNIGLSANELPETK